MLRMHYDLFQNPEEITNLMALILQQFDKQLLDRHTLVYLNSISISTLQTRQGGEQNHVSSLPTPLETIQSNGYSI